MSDPVLLDLAASIAVITFNRPAVRNALNPAAMAALKNIVHQLAVLPALRAVILTGAGGTFISGGDVRELHQQMTEQAGLEQHDLMHATLERLSTLPVPVIAAIEGAARGGGCEVALACDLRVAAEDATLGFAQIRMSVTPGWGGAGRLIQLIGYSRAMDLLLTGRVLTAQQAETLGLVNQTCPPGTALQMAQELAALLRQWPAQAVRGVKQVLKAYMSQPASDAYTIERSTFARLWASADHAEASTAFLEKRPPHFMGE